AEIVDSHQSQTSAHERVPEQVFKDNRLEWAWDELDERFQRRLQGLSADLNSLHEREVDNGADEAPQAEHDLASAQQEAIARQRWDRLLELLRRPSGILTRAQADYVRGC